MVAGHKAAADKHPSDRPWHVPVRGGQQRAPPGDLRHDRLRQLQTGGARRPVVVRTGAEPTL